MNARYHRETIRAQYNATGPQISYLRRLLDEAFAHLYHGPATCYDRHHLGRVTRAEASAAITQLKAAKATGWKRD